MIVRIAKCSPPLSADFIITQFIAGNPLIKLTKGSSRFFLLDQFQEVVKRSISQYLSRRLLPRHTGSYLKGQKGPSASDELGNRARRDIQGFLDSLQPHQLHRLRRAISAARLRMRTNSHVKSPKKVVVHAANAKSY